MSGVSVHRNVASFELAEIWRCQMGLMETHVVNSFSRIRSGEGIDHGARCR